MFNYPVYKAIKDRLITPGTGLTSPVLLGNVFWYTGQYLKGKDNTSYAVPATYIEMPKPTDLYFYSKNVLAAKSAKINVHYISHAPFKNHDNFIQDSAIAAHENTLKEIDILLDSWNAFDVNGKILTQQLIPVAGNMLNFVGNNIYSIITYRTEIYSRHLGF